MTIAFGRGHWPLIFRELARDQQQHHDEALIFFVCAVGNVMCVMERLVAAGLSHVETQCYY